MNKRLIAVMLSAGITMTALTGCTSKSSDEIRNENEIRELLEYDANTNISKQNVESYGFRVEYQIKDDKFYITFISSEFRVSYRGGYQEGSVKIKYEVDKDTYYNFKNNYSSNETQRDVELVKCLTDKFDPIGVECKEENNIVTQ